MAESPGQALARRRAQQDAVTEYDRMISGLGAEMQDVISRAGQRWWVKPSVLVDLIEASASEDDLNFVGALSAQAPRWGRSTLDVARMNRRWNAKWDDLQEVARKERDKGFQWGDIADVAKGAVRTAGSVAESAWQETQGLFRGVADALHPGEVGRTVRAASGGRAAPASETGFGEGFVGTQSSLGITLEKLFSGEVSPGEVVFGDPDALGSGFFTGGAVAREQAERARRSASINGHALTPGRLVASAVSEPGEWQHRWLSGAIDGGLIVYADPANVALGAAGRAVQRSRYFLPEDPNRAAQFMRRAVGLAEGQRKTVTDSVSDFLASRPGRRFVDRLSRMDDPVEIWERSSREIPVEWAVQLAGESDVAVVDGMVREFLGTTVARKPKAWQYGPGGTAVRFFTPSRLAGEMPRSGLLDSYDPQRVVSQLSDEMRNARVPDDEARSIVRNAMHAMSTTASNGVPLASERYAALTAAKQAVNASLRAHGVAPEASSALTRVWDSYDALRSYNIDALTGIERPLPDMVTVAGQAVPAVTPHTIEQFMSRYVPLPDVRTYREIGMRTGWLSKLPGGHAAVTAKVKAGLAADTLYRTWKPLQILRGAYVPRVVGDEQARMAVAGMSSMFSSPIAYFALAVMDDGRLGKLLDDIPGVTVGRYGADVTGARFVTRGEGVRGAVEAVDADSDLAHTLYERGSDMLFGARGMKSRKVPGFVSIKPDEPGYLEAWLDEVQFLHGNQIARRVAAGEPIDDIKDWYWQSGYRAAAVGSGDATRFAADSAGAQAAERLSPLARQVTSRDGADAYVDHIVQWFEEVTRGDLGLVDAVATGRLPAGARTPRNAPLRNGTAIHRNTKPTDEALAYVSDLDNKPAFVRGAPRLEVDERMDDFVRAGVDFFMDIIATRPSNWASRSPTFRQMYWRRVEQLLDLTSAETRDDIVRIAQAEAKLPKDAIARLRKANPSGELTLDDVNALASQYAADETKKLLYDMHNRSRFFDAFRLIFPFGEAWKEVITTWSKLLTENPRSLRTLQKTIGGARGAGFVYRDEATGEEMFTFPGSRALTQALTGVNADFRATTSGLSIAGSVMPGVGPGVQWAAGTFLPDKPKYQWVRDIVFQFGGEDEGLIKTLTPGWAEKLAKWVGGPESDRAFNNAVGEALNALASTGEYNLQDQADVERLQDDAVEAAKRIWGIRGVLQFFAPSAPQPRLFVETKDGEHVRAALVEEFYRLNQLDHTTAVQTFVERFGSLALISTVPYTRTEQAGRSVLGLRPTEKFNEFEQEHGQLFESFPHVAGLFGPQDPGYDFQVYERQARMYRESKTQTERLEDYNAMLGQIAFDSYKGQLPAKPTPEQRRWLAEWKRELMDEYPGFGIQPQNINAIEANVAELGRAAAHPSLDNAPLAAAVREYMKYRGKAIDSSPIAGWNQANSTRHLRDWLREWAEDISQRTPEFRRVWDVLLSRELNDDLDTEEGQ